MDAAIFGLIVADLIASPMELRQALAQLPVAHLDAEAPPVLGDHRRRRPPAQPPAGVHQPPALLGRVPRHAGAHAHRQLQPPPPRARPRPRVAPVCGPPSPSARCQRAEPVRYEVVRIRNGRGFVTRRVVARQAIGAILNAEC